MHALFHAQFLQSDLKHQRILSGVELPMNSTQTPVGQKTGYLWVSRFPHPPRSESSHISLQTKAWTSAPWKLASPSRWPRSCGKFPGRTQFPLDTESSPKEVTESVDEWIQCCNMMSFMIRTAIQAPVWANIGVNRVNLDLSLRQCCAFSMANGRMRYERPAGVASFNYTSTQHLELRFTQTTPYKVRITCLIYTTTDVTNGLTSSWDGTVVTHLPCLWRSEAAPVGRTRWPTWPAESWLTDTQHEERCEAGWHPTNTCLNAFPQAMAFHRDHANAPWFVVSYQSLSIHWGFVRDFHRLSLFS